MVGKEVCGAVTLIVGLWLVYSISKESSQAEALHGNSFDAINFLVDKFVGGFCSHFILIQTSCLCLIVFLVWWSQLVRQCVKN